MFTRVDNYCQLRGDQKWKSRLITMSAEVVGVLLPPLACLAIATTQAYGAAIPINYSLTKNYSFTTNANVVPTLNETRYGHVYDFSAGGGGIASETAQTYTGANANYDPFAPDSYYLNAATKTYGSFNYPKNKASVPVTRENVNGLTLAGSPYNDPTNAGGRRRM
jgi:hypothetical protein